MESIRPGFVCMSEHKFRSHLIKVARLVTHQDALNTFLLSLFSAGFVVLPRSSLSPSHLSEGRNGFLLFHSFLHTLHLICMNGRRLATPPVLPCCCLRSLLPPPSKGCAPAPLANTPSHCKRMSLSQRKQSAFIMSYLPGPPWQRVMIPGRGKRVCLGSRSAARRNSTVRSRLVWKACVGPGSYP